MDIEKLRLDLADLKNDVAAINGDFMIPQKVKMTCNTLYRVLLQLVEGVANGRAA